MRTWFTPGHGEGLLDVHHAEDVVRVVVAHRETGDPGPAGSRDEVGEGLLGSQHGDPHTRSHEVAGDPIGEAQ